MALYIKIASKAAKNKDFRYIIIEFKWVVKRILILDQNLSNLNSYHPSTCEVAGPYSNEKKKFLKVNTEPGTMMALLMI